MLHNGNPFWKVCQSLIWHFSYSLQYIEAFSTFSSTGVFCWRVSRRHCWKGRQNFQHSLYALIRCGFSSSQSTIANSSIGPTETKTSWLLLGWGAMRHQLLPVHFHCSSPPVSDAVAQWFSKHFGLWSPIRSKTESQGVYQYMRRVSRIPSIPGHVWSGATLSRW